MNPKTSVSMNIIKNLPPVLLLSFFMGLSGCQSSSDNSKGENKQKDVSTDVIKNPGGINGQSSKKPELHFKKTKHDFGKITQGEKVAHSFKFTNKGGGKLVISNANPSCGCTVPNYPKKPVKPGESGFIDVVFDSEGRKGKFTKSITIMANNPGEPKKLRITGVVKP